MYRCTISIGIRREHVTSSRTRGHAPDSAVLVKVKSHFGRIDDVIARQYSADERKVDGVIVLSGRDTVMLQLVVLLNSCSDSSCEEIVEDRCN